MIQVLHLLLLCIAGVVFAADGPAAKPNILFIVSEDQGAGDLGCLGAPDLATPHLDTLASRGPTQIASPAQGSLLHKFLSRQTFHSAVGRHTGPATSRAITEYLR